MKSIGYRCEKSLTLCDPATYKIRSRGYLDDKWTDCLGSMTVENLEMNGDTPITVLKGRVRDQAEMIGILVALYELRLPLISVELYGEE